MDLSYVSVYMENALLAKICEKYELARNPKDSVVNMAVVSQDGIVKMSTELAGSGVRMPDTGIPNGRSVARWFAQLLKQFDCRALGLDDGRIILDTVAEIEKNAEKIDEQLEYAELVYHQNDTQDYAFNSHYEEIHPDNRSAKIIGMDVWKWEELWETCDHKEFEKFLDADTKLGVEAYAPQKYPFPLLLAEGWAEETSEKKFVRKMIECYGSKTLVSGGANSVICEFERQEQQLLQKIESRIVDPRNIDFFGKSVAGVYSYADHCSTALSRSTKTDIYKQDHLFDRQILRYGGIPRQSLSSNIDYYIVSRTASSWRAYGSTEYTATPEELEIERHRRFIEKLEKYILRDLDQFDATRAKRKKELIKFIWEDEFDAWLLETYPPCDEEVLRDEDKSWFRYRQQYADEAAQKARNNIRP